MHHSQFIVTVDLELRGAPSFSKCDYCSEKPDLDWLVTTGTHTIKGTSKSHTCFQNFYLKAKLSNKGIFRCCPIRTDIFKLMKDCDIIPLFSDILAFSLGSGGLICWFSRLYWGSWPKQSSNVIWKFFPMPGCAKALFKGRSVVNLNPYKSL